METLFIAQASVSKQLYYFALVVLYPNFNETNILLNPTNM
jgi:hypothetical protein